MSGVRLFVALDLSDPARAALVEWREHALAGLSFLRPVPPESLHVTLCFLGHLDPEAVPAVAEVVRSVSSAPPAEPPTLTGCAWLPPRRPRVLAVDMTDPGEAIVGLQGALSASLAAGGWYEPERRRYRPHVTVARVRSAGGASARPPLPEAPPQLELSGTSVVLFRSHLSPKGARYEALERVSWAAPAR